jgi:hypothetical protein
MAEFVGEREALDQAIAKPIVVGRAPVALQPMAL